MVHVLNKLINSIMTENTSFLIASLVGVLLGAVSIFLFAQYFSLIGGNGASERVLENKATATSHTRQETKSESVVTKEPEFPADWFTSTNNFNLETRAIFSKVDNPAAPIYHLSS
jgi:hypothetical protein